MNTLAIPAKITRILQKQAELEDIRSYNPNAYDVRYSLLYTMFLMLSEQMEINEVEIFRAKMSKLNQEKIRWSQNLKSFFTEEADKIDYEFRVWLLKNKDKFNQRS